MKMAILVLSVLAFQHWVGGLIAWSIWFVWRLLEGSGALPKPPVWPAWIVVFLALSLSTLLSENPSGLQWAGLLQWLSLLGGIWALQDLLRRETGSEVPLIAGLLVAGTFDAVRWTWDSIGEYMIWWALRTEGLPLFPFRIRLFGSHGSTQAAAWLAGLLLVALSAPVTVRVPKPFRWGWMAILLLWSILLGLCDSRLAYAGFLVGLLVRDLSKEEQGQGVWLALVPAFVWWFRDLAHPSTVSSGGGIGLGFETTVVVACLLLVRWAVLPWIQRSSVFDQRSKMLILGSCLVPVAVPILFAGLSSMTQLNAFFSGRLEFWTVAFDSWRSHPFLGVGPWTFVHSYAAQVDWTFGFLAMHPHNAFLQVLSAGGLVLVLGMMAILIGGALRIGSDEGSLQWRWIRPAFVGLAVGMTFDSPLSSPQVMSLLIICAAVFLGSCTDPGRLTVPRTLVLAPLLLLVPLSLVWERQTSKAPLLEAGELLAKRQWRDAAEQILTASKGAPNDPQWSRNVLMARTMLAMSRESLAVLLPDWEEQVRREPGFLPNRVHLRWIDWRLGPRKPEADSLLAIVERLGNANEGLPAKGMISPNWTSTYPSDRPEYWRRQLEVFKQQGDRRKSDWIEAWFAHRFPSGVVGHGRRLTVTGARGVAEAQLYGSAGTRWLLIPQVANLQFQLPTKPK